MERSGDVQVGREMMSDLQTFYPLAEEGIDETVFPVVIEYESVGHESVNRPLHRCGVKDGRRREKFHGEDLSPSFGRQSCQHAHLECRETSDKDFVMIPFAGKDDLKTLRERMRDVIFLTVLHYAILYNACIMPNGTGGYKRVIRRTK